MQLTVVADHEAAGVPLTFNDKVSLPAPPVSVSVLLVRMYVVLIGVEVTGVVTVVTVVPVAVATEVLRLAVALVTEACVASTDVKNARPEAAAMAPL